MKQQGKTRNPETSGKNREKPEKTRNPKKLWNTKYLHGWNNNNCNYIYPSFI